MNLNTPLGIGPGALSLAVYVDMRCADVNRAVGTGVLFPPGCLLRAPTQCPETLIGRTCAASQGPGHSTHLADIASLTSKEQSPPDWRGKYL